MEKVFVRSPYNYDVDAVSNESALVFDGPTRAQQHFKEQCDINYIMRKFGQTGQLPPDVRVPQYGDFTGITDFHSAMTAVAQAHESFDALPAEVRSRFVNDPGRFVDFCMDPANESELVRMGLAKARATPTPPVPSAAPLPHSEPPGGGSPGPVAVPVVPAA